MHRKLLCVQFICGLVCMTSTWRQTRAAVLDADASSDAILRMVHQEGFPIERHTVPTEDGYQLGVYHIPATASAEPNATEYSNNTTNTTPVVLIMHGLFASAADFLSLGRRYGLGYILSGAGFDVWLGNSRGTTFSRAHRSLNPDTDADFWDYSFHEIGLYDLAAMIDYVRAASGTEAIHYVAHSQGCTALFVLLSERSEYNARLRSVNAMAPAVFMSASQAVDGVVVRYSDQLQTLSQRFGVYELSTKRPEWRAISGALATLCPSGSRLQLMCVSAYFDSFSARLPPLTKRMARNIYDTSPNAVSVKQLIHFSQLIGTGRFQQYDYKEVANRHIYGRPEPPEYALRNRVNVSMQVFYGTADTVTNAQDVQNLIELFEPVVKKIWPAVGANHFDFVLSKDAHEKFYGRIVQMIRNAERAALR